MPALAESRQLTSAQRWADYLRDDFARRLGHDFPLPIEPGFDANGECQATVAGVVVPFAYRHRYGIEAAEYVAMKLVRPFNEGTVMQWFDYPAELLAFVAWMHAEHFVADSDGFAQWLKELGRRPASWTVEFIVSRASLAG